MKYQVAYIGNNDLHYEALTQHGLSFGFEVKKVAPNDSVFANSLTHIS